VTDTAHPALFHLVVGAAALAAALTISSATVNRLVKRKLRLSIFFLGVYLAFNALLMVNPGLLVAQTRELLGIERVVLAAALINLFVVGLLNPLRADRIPDRFPSIVQDAIVIGVLILVATFAFGDEFLATSAVSAVVVGFALQDTLGNAFAGLAIQSEKPFNVGHWISVGDHEGRVAEVTWRATKLRTKTGNFVIVPNSEVGKAPITNYSEPAAPTRLSIEVGVSYDAPPNAVKRVIKAALSNCPLVLKAPPPDAMIRDFGDSAVLYRVRFWTDNFELDEEAADEVRSSLYYAFRREGIEIPYPIQAEYTKEFAVVDESTRLAEREELLRGVDLFASLTDDQRAAIAAGMRPLDFGHGEVIVREGDPGKTMYVVASGRVNIVLASNGQKVATTEQGGYFGEMSLLTGDARTASVIADGDVRVLEIDAEVFRRLADVSPQAVEQVGIAAATRRAELMAARQSAQASAVAEAPASVLVRMRRFLRI
jgi:small-conductance mechanosensitive channel/CRP-like cAMP-binding protein